MAEVICYIGNDSPWVRYTVRHVLQRMLGWEVEIITERGSALSAGIPVIVYDTLPIEGCFHIKPNTAEEPLHEERPQDIFFAVGELLSLADEHGTGQRDPHGRISAPKTRNAQREWLDRPVADEWVLAFAQDLHAQLPGLPPVRRRNRHFATMDVDNGFMFKGRPLWRTLGASVRDILRADLTKLVDRWRTLAGRRPDPYDVYDDLRRITDGNTDRVILNFLVSPRGEFDHAVGLSNPLMRQRVQDVSTWAEVGLHPSYHSSDSIELFAQEHAALQRVVDHTVTISRQHFLRMKLPSTFNELERIGIREDHSIGLADSIGFRAGTCTPFPYFDPVLGRETNLMLHPFALMDSAMCYKMHSTPEAAITASKRMVDAVKRVNGTFIGVWHERFLSDYGAEKGWRRVVEETIRYARP